MTKHSGTLFFCLAFTLAGTSVVSARFVTGRLDLFGIAAVSLFFALVFLLPFCVRQLAGALRRLTPKILLSLFLQAFFGIFLFRAFLLSGLKLTSAGEAGILTGSTPAITAVLAVLVLRERPDGRKLAGVLGTVCGVLLLQEVMTGGLTARDLLGNMLVLCAAACESVFNILSRVTVLKTPTDGVEPISPMVRTFLVALLALLLCLVPAILGGSATQLRGLGLREWLALLWYGVFVTALAFICWYRGISRGSALSAAACSGMMPLTAMLLSVSILGERAGWQQWTGAVLVVLGMVLIGSSAAGREKTTDKGRKLKNVSAE